MQVPMALLLLLYPNLVVDWIKWTGMGLWINYVIFFVYAEIEIVVYTI